MKSDHLSLNSIGRSRRVEWVLTDEDCIPPGEYSVLKRNCVAFPAEFYGKRITCQITFSALMNLPGAQRRHHLTTFRVHRIAIERQAALLIERDGWAGSDITIS